ncbi:MAG: hypothetical protein HKL96_01445 [Phycisphaerales bacterium]|nr:hypothetical protein [Phycisphaerales bacterium]
MSNKVVGRTCLLLVLILSAESATLGAQQQPSKGLITLHLTNAPASKAVEKIMTQAGLKYTLAPGSNPFAPEERGMMGSMILVPPTGSHQVAQKAPTVTMNLVRVPFWTAMHQLAVQADISIWNPDDSYTTGLQITNTNNLIGPHTPVSIDGDFLTEIYGINLSRGVSFLDRTPAIQQRFTLSLIFAIRPPLRILEVLPNQPHVTVANDNRGHTLIYPGETFGTQGSDISAPTTQWWADLWMPLRRPAGIGNRIKLFKGTIKAIVATGLKKLRYSFAPGRPHSFKAMGLKITVQDIKKVHGYYQVGYSVVIPARLSSKARSVDTETKIKEAENPLNFALEDARGRKFLWLPWDQSFRHFTLHFGTNFPLDYPKAAKPVGPPTTLVITLPANARLVTVPFSFRNVLLP